MSVSFFFLAYFSLGYAVSAAGAAGDWWGPARDCLGAADGPGETRG
jgi:hypothetical protein